MTFRRLVLSTLNCPRCNAIAQERIEEERGDVCVVYIVCSKCKLNRYRGLTTRKAVRLLSKMQIIQHRIANEELTKSTRSRLEGQLVKIRQQIDKENLRVGS